MRRTTPLRPVPAPDRRARSIAGAILAVLVAAAVAVPVAAVDPAASLQPDASVLASGDPSASASASASPSDSPSGSAPPSPSASASASASASPSASPSSSAVAPPTATPSPSPTPVASGTWPKMAWPTSATTLGTSVTFYGRGYGHGVGMNQYGAKGRAQAGQTAAQILAAYFKGSAPATVSATQNTRVLLMSGYNAVSTAPLVVRGRYKPWTIDGVKVTFPTGATLKVWRTAKTVDGTTTTTWRFRVFATDGTTVLYAGTAGKQLIVRGASSLSRLQLVSKPSSYDTYRGILKLFLGTSTLNVVNHVPLDMYLRGVVPVEMSSGWPTEALKAQTIAARSYAVRRLHPTSGTYDLFDDTRSQVYRGLEAETTVTNTLITSFPGRVITYGGSVVNAFFFSTGGGATENNEYVFVSSSGGVGTAVPYLRGIPDRRADGTAFDAGAPLYAWQSSTLTRSQLTAIFKRDSRTSVGDLTKLDLTKRGVSGRLYRVTLYGSAGSKTVSGDVLRSVYNAYRPSGTLSLRSNLFDAKPIAGS